MLSGPLSQPVLLLPFTDIDGPTNLVTNHVTEDTATISWNGAQAPIDRYVVSYASADGDTKEVSVGKDKRTTTLMGLKPGIEYIIYIWAVKDSQQSRKTSTKAITGSHRCGISYAPCFPPPILYFMSDFCPDYLKL